MTAVKICGVTRREDALVAAGSGADFIGFIFVTGTPRYIEAEHAREIIEAVRSRGHQARFVGVFRNSGAAAIRDIARRSDIEIVQLHGNEDESLMLSLPLPVIRAVGVRESVPNRFSVHADWLLFDTPGGGSGNQFEWRLLEGLEVPAPFFLAGGLSPDNVRDAISVVRPFGVDVSTGVEAAPGIKDHDLVRSFIERAKANG